MIPGSIIPMAVFFDHQEKLFDAGNDVGKDYV